MKGAETVPTATRPAPEAGAGVELSANTLEVLRLAESGVEPTVLLAFVRNTTSPFALSAEGIIYLKDVGIGEEVITGMLHQDTVLRDQRVPAAPTPTPVAPPAAVPTEGASTPVYVSNAPPEVAYYYDSLAPYGAWIELEGVGWCWQPRIVMFDHSWRPYWHGGRWLWTDSGWYWCSDYSWGWAPFHYGRWHQHPRHGWVWTPDLAWGPAWVCWRSSDVHCGWAPLPPGARFVFGQGFFFNGVSVGINFDFHLAAGLFSFVEIRHMTERQPYLHAVPRERVVEIHNHTTVINNYVSGPGNTVVNSGIAVDRVAAVSHREVPKVSIREMPAATGQSVRPDRVVKIGSASVVYRPELRPPVRPAPTVAQKIDERHPIVRPAPHRVPAATPPQLPSLRPPPGTGVGPGGDRPTTRAQPPSGTPRATPGLPERVEPRTGPAPAPSIPARPAAPQPAHPTTPTGPRSVIATPLPVPPPSRNESPRGRDQRRSIGSPMMHPSPEPPAVIARPTQVSPSNPGSRHRPAGEPNR